MSWNFLKIWRRVGSDGTSGDYYAREYPTPTSSVDIDAALAAAAPADADFSDNPLRGIHVGAAVLGAVVYVKLHEDLAFLPWIVSAGAFIDGAIVAVGASTTATGLIGVR